MPDSDPHRLAEELEQQVDRLEAQSDRLGQEVSSVRKDWEHKRADPNVPGAPPTEHRSDEQPQSPAPQAPPPQEGPSAAEEAPELEVGPPADPGDN